MHDKHLKANITPKCFDIYLFFFKEKKKACIHAKNSLLIECFKEQMVLNISLMVSLA